MSEVSIEKAGNTVNISDDDFQSRWIVVDEYQAKRLILMLNDHFDLEEPKCPMSGS